ncbi:MAG: glycine cleavage system aminomethyltransferase GcvT [Leptothrix ochracea]|uniref:glycine cleavage system aminomethyltransferase GcvT n=1 Tax=Leptothrix ochracea TaxID=735331 RepID=UPI0034E1F51E
MSLSPQDALSVTPLHALHRELGARMVPFAGYDMPVQYPAGILAEHRQCRSAAALFDVSHMGQVRLVGADAAAALETLVPVDVLGLGAGKQRYAFFTNEQGGLLDDLMITRPPMDAHGDAVAAFGDLFLVVNAGCKAADIAHLQSNLGDNGQTRGHHRCQVIPMPERALLALQGPQAAMALARLNPGVNALTFMTGAVFTLAGATCFVTRSGYTGEDGFEISVPAEAAEALARALLSQPEVEPAGLGARDTLRLEAGLCLYGHDIDSQTSPVEAGLNWAMQKVRRPDGARAGGYPGADVLAQQWRDGATRKRVGLIGLERLPVREGAVLFNPEGQSIGRVTSGTVSPTLGHPIAMAWIDSRYATVGSAVLAEVRGKRTPMQVSAMPFVPQRYFRG